MKTVFDFFILSPSAAFSEQIQKVCSENGWTFLLVNSVEESLEKIFECYFRAFFVVLDSENEDLYSFAEWLNSFENLSPLVFCSDHFDEKTQQFSNQKILLRDDIQNPGVLRGKLEEVLSFSNNRVARSIHGDLDSEFCVAGRSENTEKLWNQTQELARSDDALIFQGGPGVGKTHWMHVACESVSPEEMIRFDAKQLSIEEQIQVFQQKTCSHDLDHGPLVFMCENIDQVAEDIQEILIQHFYVERLKNDKGEAVPLIVLGTVGLEYHFLTTAFDRFLKNYTMMILPLKSRSEDVADLVSYYCRFLNDSPHVHYAAKDFLLSLEVYDWPENVRELFLTLQNVLNQREDSGLLTSRELPVEILQKSFYLMQRQVTQVSEMIYKDAKKMALKNFHEEYIPLLLEQSDNNYTVAAEWAGMERSNFMKLLKNYDFQVKKG